MSNSLVMSSSISGEAFLRAEAALSRQEAAEDMFASEAGGQPRLIRTSRCLMRLRRFLFRRRRAVNWSQKSSVEDVEAVEVEAREE
jgi:hypothetical protein